MVQAFEIEDLVFFVNCECIKILTWVLEQLRQHKLKSLMSVQTADEAGGISILTETFSN